MCGGTGFPCLGVLLRGGLSPRVRGNRLASPIHSDPDGSIPACAGEPGTLRTRGSIRSVYPRVCGEPVP